MVSSIISDTAFVVNRSYRGPSLFTILISSLLFLCSFHAELPWSKPFLVAADDLPTCLPKDFHYEYTECDKFGGRWRVSVPDPHKCTGGVPNAPIRGKDCTFTCDAGQYLDIQGDQECHPCPKGTYSLGGGVRFDSWDHLPPGFYIKTERFSEISILSKDNQYSTDTTNCSSSGWLPKGNFIAAYPKECATSLVYTANLVKAGSVTFEYQFSESASLLHFLVQNNQCQNLDDNRSNQYPPATEEGQWHQISLPLKSGLNVLFWKALSLLSSEDDESALRPVLIRKIEVKGVAFSSECTKCRNGTFSDRVGASYCQECPENTYSQRGASECKKCDAKTEYSTRESSSCKKKHACTEMDYYEYQNPCDKGGQTQTKYLWMKPKRCRTDLPGAKQLPAPGKMERCPQCNPGMMLIPGVGCRFCKNDEYSDGASPCEKCPVSTSPQIGYTYKWWNSLPPNVTSHCFNFEANKKNPSPQTKEYLRTTKSILQREERRCVNGYWINLCKEIQAASDRGDSKTMHSLMRTALGLNTTKLAKLKSENGEPIEDQGEQLKRWAEHYSKLYAVDVPEHPDMEATLPSFDVFTELDDDPTVVELSEAISALSNGKAPGEDGIPAEIFKENKDVLLPQLHALLLQCWRQREIPHKMRDTKVVTLYKNKGDKGDCNNYRGISLLCVAEKECVTNSGWMPAKEYVRTQYGPGELGYLLLVMEVPGFRGNEAVILDKEVKLSQLTFVFETNCSGQCYLYFMVDHQSSRPNVVKKWFGTQQKQSFVFPILRNGTTKFSWIFMHSQWITDKGRDIGQMYITDYARIYSIEITNTITGGAGSCQKCPIGTRQDGCVPCPDGQYINVNTTKCTPCPPNTVVHAGNAWGIESCKSCGPGLQAFGGHQCVSDCMYKDTINNRDYNFKKLSGFQHVTGGHLFTSAGTQYYHGFNMSLCGFPNGPKAICINNVTTLPKEPLGGPRILTASICRSTLVPSRDHTSLVSTQPVSLGDHLVKIITNENMTKEFMETGFEINAEDIHFHYKAESPTAACPNGRETIITLRCDVKQDKQGTIDLPPKCPDGTCDGCTFHFVWRSQHACPVCKDKDYDVIVGECINGEQTVHYYPPKHCMIISGEKPVTKKKKCSAIPFAIEIGSICALSVGLLLLSLVVYCWKKNKKLEYKYMMLVENSAGEKELPAADTCALDDGEEEHFDVVDFPKDTKRKSLLKTIRSKMGSKMQSILFENIPFDNLKMSQDKVAM